ncbi:Putative suppressor of disruption of TFIIS [Sporothrix epigloea]|uniref:Suppressor of disruption of TFIIS n=1 Tax=Sporothrix epigloea TaxID=1892477 RepID=A0ABP0DNN1_9PEZI
MGNAVSLPKRPTGDVSQTHKKVLFFLFIELIGQYFTSHLSLPWDEALRLHKEYYTNYGLAIKGLVSHHQIDPLEYNRKVDDALPLEDIIKPNEELKQLLRDIDRSRVRLWLFTNAYITHGQRIVRLLEVEDQFDGITYCDYSKQPIVCKPHEEMFAKAMREAGINRATDCYFVGALTQPRPLDPYFDFPSLDNYSHVFTDDSYGNCKAAKDHGWTAVHLVEDGVSPPQTPASQFQITNLEELRSIFPDFFKNGIFKA